MFTSNTSQHSYASLFVALLSTFAKEVKGSSPREWYNYQTSTESIWNTVYLEYQAAMTAMPEVEGEYGPYLKRALENAMAKVPNLQKKLFLFSFDEFRTVLDSSMETDSLFKNFRTAMGQLPFGKDKENTAFCLLLDTTSRVANFMPAAKVDQSGRVRNLEKKLFPPFIPLDFNASVFYKLPSAKTAADVSTFARMAAGSMPVFATFYYELIKAGETEEYARLKTEELARAKLTLTKDGVLGDGDWNGPAGLHRALALLAPRVSVSVTPWQHAAAELISSYIATCLWINAKRDGVWMTYIIDKIIAQAAAQVLNFDVDDKTWTRAVKELSNSIVNFIVTIDRGELGELIAKLILTKAWDTAIKSDSPAIVYRDFTRPMPLNHFLATLLGEEMKDEISKVGCLFPCVTSAL